MPKKILLIELCNYIDYPLGGHLSFAKQMIKAFGNEIALVGVTTDDETPIGCWTKKIIEGVSYDYFSVKRVYPTTTKSIIPKRIVSYYRIKKYRNKLIKYGCQNIVIQTPEVFFNFHNYTLLNICLILPGLGNPLRISRYYYGKLFAAIYENYFFPAINKANILLAAADNNSIEDFIKRGKNKFDKNKLKQFPTRYDDRFFNPRNKELSKFKLSIKPDKTLVVTSGRLNFFKGWKFLIDTFELFQNKNQSAIFVFLGEGEDKSKIENYIIEKKLSDRIFLKGRVNHEKLSEYLNAADLFVMGSYAEGWSTSLVEAVACATPICTTNFSSARELVFDGINGFVTNDRNERTFSENMRKAILLPKNKLMKKALDIKKLSVTKLKEDLLNSWNINL